MHQPFKAMKPGLLHEFFFKFVPTAIVNSLVPIPLLKTAVFVEINEEHIINHVNIVQPSIQKYPVQFLIQMVENILTNVGKNPFLCINLVDDLSPSSDYVQDILLVGNTSHYQNM